MKEKNDVLNCFGKPASCSKRCRSCEYRVSCNYCAATAASVESRSRLTSFEEIQTWLPDSADCSNIPGNDLDEPEKQQLIPMLGQFFRFLLELDDYTVGIISELISPSDKSVKHCTVSHLGKLHGCSRQAMHRKILDVIAHHPELTTLLKGTMYKLSSGRQRFMRRRSEAFAAGI